MQTNDRRDFNAEAATWDDNPGRVHIAHSVTEALFRAVPMGANWSALDYGAGTGLVTLALSARLMSVRAADSSAGMLAKLSEKAGACGLANVETVLLDLESAPLPHERFDLVVSTMTLHHIDDAAATTAKLAALVSPGGWLAIADLDLDDGEFHADPTGIRHNGFDRADIARWFADTGLDAVTITTAVSFEKEVAGKGPREFSVFLAVGHR